MKRRFPKSLFWALMILAALCVIFALNTARHAAAVPTWIDSAAEREVRLAPFWRVVPEGGVGGVNSILLSGCDGVRDNMAYWAGQLTATGGAALILDSHTPRGLDQLEAWRLACVGQVLPGAERAGDLAVAMALTEREDMQLLGASHGGWTVLEFLGQLMRDEVPPGLDDWPAAPATMLARIDAAVLLYPYCGLLNGADEGDWSGAPPLLMILAENDEIISTPACLALADRLTALGADIETVVIPEVGHGFDQQDRALFSTLTYDIAARDRAADLIADFLARHSAADED
ncbi:dienelactone hydrolase family protein [Paracoccaceae bacterium GXU_MW_L88]